MDLKALQKAIHDAAMAVRAGDWSQYDKLQELRKEHRKACGIPEAEPVAAPAPKEEAVEQPLEEGFGLEEALEEKPKKKKKH